MNLTIFLIFAFLMIIALLVGVYFIFNYFFSRRRDGDQSFILLQNQMNELSRVLDSKLSESAHLMRGHLGESLNHIKEMTRELTKVGEGNKQVMDIAGQLRSLQDILKNPKQRGILGEYYLETVLKNVLPPGSFQMQYEFKDGTIVDAAIMIKNKIIPVDSKFSLENYNRILESRTDEERLKWESAFRDDLKNRIDETSKYIKPDEGTMEFAFMFIPSEAVYYDLLINKVGAAKASARDLIQYAAGDKKVMVVSPTTFLAYLQTVLQGLKALQIEESAKEIRKRVEELGRHLGSFDNYMKKLGTHMATSVNTYNTAYRELGKIDKDVLRISGKAAEIEPAYLEKPSVIEEEND